MSCLLVGVKHRYAGPQLPCKPGDEGSITITKGLGGGHFDFEVLQLRELGKPK